MNWGNQHSSAPDCQPRSGRAATFHFLIAWLLAKPPENDPPSPDLEQTPRNSLPTFGPCNADPGACSWRQASPRGTLVGTLPRRRPCWCSCTWAHGGPGATLASPLRLQRSLTGVAELAVPQHGGDHQRVAQDVHHDGEDEHGGQGVARLAVEEVAIRARPVAAVQHLHAARRRRRCSAAPPAGAGPGGARQGEALRGTPAPAGGARRGRETPGRSPSSPAPERSPPGRSTEHPNPSACSSPKPARHPEFPPRLSRLRAGVPAAAAAPPRLSLPAHHTERAVSG